MSTVPGARDPRALKAGGRGFTLIELLVVLAIVAIASAGVMLGLRDSSTSLLEREAQRLGALLEVARAQSRMSSNPVRWRTTETGFKFEGLPGTSLPQHWLHADVVVLEGANALLGPEPVIGAQRIVLQLRSDPQRSLSLATDGVRPFRVEVPGGSE